VTHSAPPWTSIGFADALRRWIERDKPDKQLRHLVVNWALDVTDDPYLGARRARLDGPASDGDERVMPDMWEAIVPGSLHGAQQIVYCLFWISEVDRTVTCDSITTLGYPV